MKVFRYMSRNEFEKLINNKTLLNITDHSVTRGKVSNAFGFCFGIGDEKDAIEAGRRLKGITSIEILLTAELRDDVRWDLCQGRYIDYREDHFEQHPIYINELCTHRYQLSDFKSYKYKEYPLPDMLELGVRIQKDLCLRNLLLAYVPPHVIKELDDFAKNKDLELLPKTNPIWPI